MFRVRTIAIALFLVSLLSGPPVAAEDLQQLDFMSGAWGTDGIIVEYWLPPAAGRMIGIHHATEGEKASFFEYLRIEAREDGIVYVASPMGSGTTDFRLTEVSDSRAVFENPEHDFPQKIIYTVTGSRLEAEVGAVQDGEWRSRTLRLTRIECGSTAVRDSDHDESP